MSSSFELPEIWRLGYFLSQVKGLLSMFGFDNNQSPHVPPTNLLGAGSSNLFQHIPCTLFHLENKEYVNAISILKIQKVSKLRSVQ